MEEYHLVLESQLGPREGTLQLEDQNGTLKGTINLLGYENPVFGKWIGDHSLRLSHNIHTLVSDLTCISIFEIKENKIFGTLYSEQNTMQWYGEIISKTKVGKEKNVRK